METKISAADYHNSFFKIEEASRSSKIYPKKVLLVDALQQSFMAIARV
jgi:hypothetical protein